CARAGTLGFAYW
nr:immunoglobulin heavy chain junction region [Mus musculus]